MHIFICFMLIALYCSVIYLYKNDTMTDIGMCSSRVAHSHMLTLHLSGRQAIFAPTLKI